MKNICILENIRSVYNVGNIIRTADALGWDVWFTGYTATPESNPRVHKTSLGAEDHVNWKYFETTERALQAAKELGCLTAAAELDERAIALNVFSQQKENPVAVVFGNEVVGVEKETLERVESIVFIPMAGVKESLNVGQSAAIFMRELGKGPDEFCLLK